MKSKMLMKVSSMAGRSGLALKKASPEILIGVGVVSAVTSTVLACKATLKVEDVISGANEDFDKIKEARDKYPSETYSEKDAKKDTYVVYVQTGVKFIKLYGPAISVGLLSIGCFIGAHGIVKKRNVALMAAYTALDQGFTDYRKRVAGEYGDDVDYNFKNGIHEEVVTKTETDEDGKKKKVKETVKTLNPDNRSIYSRFFDELNPNWTANAEYNMVYLRAQQNYFNDMLKVRGHVFLNEVYDGLGLERSKAGQVVGWVMGNDGDNFIDFGLYDGANRRFVNGVEEVILLDFNVDGVVYDQI